MYAFFSLAEPLAHASLDVPEPHLIICPLSVLSSWMNVSYICLR